jgi:transposase
MVYSQLGRDAMVPRLLRLNPQSQKKLSELQKKAEREGAYRVAKRLQAVILNSRGHSSGELASILSAPRSKVSEWLSNFEEYGVEGLLEGYRSGRPTLLSKEQLIELYDIVESGPVAYGLDSGIWTSPMIARIIEEEYGVLYHPGHVRKLLHKLGFSVQRPKRVLALADEEKKDQWHRKTFPNLKKSEKRKLSPHLYGRSELSTGFHPSCHMEPDWSSASSLRDRCS